MDPLTATPRIPSRMQKQQIHTSRWFTDVVSLGLPLSVQAVNASRREMKKDDFQTRLSLSQIVTGIFFFLRGQIIK
jgi:hypothetical protein